MSVTVEVASKQYRMSCNMHAVNMLSIIAVVEFSRKLVDSITLALINASTPRFGANA